MQVKKIAAKHGNELEVQMTDEFIGHVKKALSLNDDQDVSDDQIMNFIHDVFKKAIDKHAADQHLDSIMEMEVDDGEKQ